VTQEFVDVRNDEIEQKILVQAEPQETAGKAKKKRKN
jgi:hypothetical protein